MTVASEVDGDAMEDDDDVSRPKIRRKLRVIEDDDEE